MLLYNVIKQCHAAVETSLSSAMLLYRRQEAVPFCCRDVIKQCHAAVQTSLSSAILL